MRADEGAECPGLVLPSIPGKVQSSQAESVSPARMRAQTMRIFVSAGEPSGDLHAANLIHALRRRRPEATFVGFGGGRMEEAGAEVLYPLVELAVMWFGRVLINLHKFLALASRADRYFRHQKPDAVVL